MAHKKGVGSSRNGRDSNPKYRGVKKYGGEKVTTPFLGPEFRVPNSQDVRRARNLICLAAALIAGTALALLKARDAFH